MTTKNHGENMEELYNGLLKNGKVIMPTDDGYISDYLIHWTGINKKTHKFDDNEGARVLTLISSNCELLLSANPIHWFHRWFFVGARMVCFTDVPLAHSAQHCSRYGRFGIAFHKLKIMNKGAQPVFYASHASKTDMDIINKFLQDEQDKPTIKPNVFHALHRHFYFVQRLSDGLADRHDTFYYEREWRLGAQSLLTEQENIKRRQKARLSQEPINPRYVGLRVVRDGKEFFSFEEKDVAFLIVPDGWEPSVKNPHNFPVFRHEELVNMMKR